MFNPGNVDHGYWMRSVNGHENHAGTQSASDHDPNPEWLQHLGRTRVDLLVIWCGQLVSVYVEKVLSLEVE